MINLTKRGYRNEGFNNQGGFENSGNNDGRARNGGPTVGGVPNNDGPKQDKNAYPTVIRPKPLSEWFGIMKPLKFEGSTNPRCKGIAILWR